MDIKNAKAACQNILLKMRCSKHDDVLVIFDEEKQDLARIMADQILVIRANPYVLKVPVPTKGKFASRFVNFLSDVVKTEFIIILLSHSMDKAKGIMDVIGSPSMGTAVVLPWENQSSRFFCDWTLPVNFLVRVYSADPVEIEYYCKILLKELSVGKSVRITTDLGTDIVLETRSWLWADGEIFTAPIENSAQGIVVYDSSMYWGKPKDPIRVTLENGKIQNIECWGLKSEQYQMFLVDSKKDKGASVLAELGIGINPNGDPYGHIMEAEQARGTCHFDFGNNIPFGGSNQSSIHYGGTVRKPTIYINEHIIMTEGKLCLGKTRSQS